VIIQKYGVMGIIFFLSLFTIDQAFASVPELRFDQTNIIVNHKDIITYIGDPSESAPTVTLRDGAHSMDILLDPVPNSLGVFRKLIQFTTGGADDQSIPKFNVNSLPATISVEGPNSTSDTATIQSAAGNPAFSNRRSDNTWQACPSGDTDLDGLCNSWEKGTTLEIDYPAGTKNYIYNCNPECSPNHKDIFIEVDYMTSHRPNQEAVDQVVAAFANAPAINPDGTSGITLHVQVDDLIAHMSDTPFPGLNLAGKQGFDQIKTISFGTSNDRGAPGTSDATWWSTTGWKQKKQAFHYVLFVHQQRSASTSSGIAEVNGNDAMISLGPFDGMIGNPDQQAGTLMHELGHNLNLNHGGGPLDTVNCKPNHLSIMSFSRQFSDLVSDRSLDFSHQKLDPTPLSESALDETSGIQRYDHNPSERVVYGPNLPATLPTTGGPINWDNTGNADNPTATANINNIGTFCISSSGSESYEGYNDWANINLNSRGDGNFADGRPAGGIPSAGAIINQESPECPPVSNILSRIPTAALASQMSSKAREQLTTQFVEPFRKCGGGYGEDIISQIQYSTISPNKGIDEMIYDTNELEGTKLQVPNEEEFEDVIYDNTEVSSDIVYQSRILRIDSLIQYVNNIDSEILDKSSKDILLEEYAKVKSLIKQDKMAEAITTLTSIDYSVINDPKIAQELKTATSDVNSSFSQAVPEFGDMALIMLVSTMILILYLGKTKTFGFNPLQIRN
jgi:hypothetical protein